jgi:gamma-glutamyltranspeptidase
VEQGFALGVYGALRAHGYLPSNRVATLQFAGVHAAWVGDDGRLVGAADPRRDGVAAGY